MPNWNFNALAVHGPANVVAKFKEQAVGYEPSLTADERARTKPCRLNFHSLVPIPDEVIKGDGDALEQWCLEHWGVSEEAARDAFRDAVTCHVEQGNPIVVRYSFETRWSPPVAFVVNVSKKWPTLLFLLHYREEIVERFGIAKAQAGNVEHYEIKA